MSLFGHPKVDTTNYVSTNAIVLSGDNGMSGTTSWSALIDLVVTLPGKPPFRVRYDGMIHRDKELIDGFEVPVRVDPDDPSKVEINWDEVPTVEQRIANRDPAIFDPVGSWNRLEALRRKSGMITANVPVQESRWGSGTIEGWPPAEALPKGRQPGTAWVLSQSEDAGNCEFGDGFMPPGRNHYKYSGTCSYGPHKFLSWMVLLVKPEYGEPYGLHLRSEVVRWRNAPVLPVALDPSNPTDVEFCWDYAPNLAHEVAEQLTAGVADMHARVDMAQKLMAGNTAAVAASVASIADPAMREQVAEMWAKQGVTVDASAPPPPASSTTDRLERLHASGILSDAEYQAELAKIQSGHQPS
jgi:hypothetical protein